MDGSSHNKPLPFSFKRPNFQNSTQKPRNNNNNIGPRKPANLTNEADSPQTQSFRLPENQTSISLKQPTGNINSISKPFFSLTPHLQSHSDSAPTSSRLRHPSSHIARPIFGSHAVKNKPSFKTELNENSAAMIQVGRRELSPFRGGYQAHTPAPLNDPKPEPELEGQVQEYPLDAVKQEQPFTLALLSNSPRLSSSNGQPSLPFSHSPSSSAYPVQNFPESPNDIQFESSHIRAPSLASTVQSQSDSLPQKTPSPPQTSHSHSSRSRSQSIIIPNLDMDMDMDGDAEMRNTSAALIQMTNNANSLRVAKFELAEGKRHVESLESQLDTSKIEKAELARRLVATKDAATKAIEASAKSLEALQTSFKSLKKTSDESSAFLTQVRVGMAEFKVERERAAEFLKKIEPLLSEDGEYINGSETKSLVGELQDECSKTREVVSILRDKLVTVSGDLAGAKSRVRELEMTLLDNKMSLKANTESLLASGRQLSEMALFLNKQKNESLEALTCAAEAEQRLQIANEQIVELSQALDRKVEQLTAIRGVQQENSNLRSQLEGKQAEVVSLGVSITAINQTLSEARQDIQEQQSKLQVLHTTIAFQEQNLKDFEERTLKAESQTTEQSGTIQSLRDKVQDMETREVAEALKRERLVCERDVLVNRVRVLESEVGDGKRRIGERDIKLHQADTMYQVLQERFDDQSVTLRITKECNGDLNERLISTESTHAASIGQLQLEIAVLQEQKTTQLDKIDELRLDMKYRRESDTAMIATLQDQLSRQESDGIHTVQTAERRADAAERNLAEARSSMECLRDEMDKISRETNVPSAAHQEELSALVVRLREQEALVKSSAQRVDTIGKRYTEGDLNDAEAAFAHSLIKKTQALHDLENVAKANELRRRDNSINALQSKISILESEVSRLLSAETKSRAASGIETKSMMDIAPFIYSSPTRSPEEDAPSQNDDSSTGVARPPSLPGLLASSTVSSARSHITGERPPHNRTTPNIGSSSAKLGPLPFNGRTNFSRLDTDASDEIVDEEDDDEPLLTKLGKRDRSTQKQKGPSTPRVTRHRAGTRQQNAIPAEASENEHNKIAE